MDLQMNKKEIIINEWLHICLDTCEDYTYVLHEDIYRMLTDYSDLIYDKIIKSNCIHTMIEETLENEIKSVILNEEIIVESNRILTDMLFYKLGYVYQEDMDTWLKGINTAEDYYSYLTNLTIDGYIGCHIDKLDNGNLELSMDFYDCGIYSPVLIASNNNFNNVVQLFGKKEDNKSSNKKNSWHNYNNITLKMMNGESLKPNKRLEKVVSDIIVNYETEKQLNF